MAAQSAVEAELAALRDGMRTNLTDDLSRALAANEISLPRDVTKEHSRILEAAANGSAIRLSRAGSRLPYRQLYVSTMRALSRVLPVQIGQFPDEIVALMYYSKKMTAAEVVEKGLNPPEGPEPREIIRRLFLKTLIGASPVYAGDRHRALETARQIEVSCFNASVRASKESEEPPRRQWDSPVFVDIYSTRCGTIAVLLNPASAPCRAYKSNGLLISRLLGESGVMSLSPEDLGELNEKELCPAAVAKERAEIAMRAEQKVAEKESNLFRCPHCGMRRCTYLEVQRRSLDEAPDYLCRCLNPQCGRRFTGR
jgi:DNA-directed RNA polymerase subunit M/transcription elongation factor TFIIS